MVIPPLLDTWDELEDAVEPFLLEMFFAVPTIDLPLLGAEIDAVSQPILSPETTTPTPETEASDPTQTPYRSGSGAASSAASTASASSGAVSRTCQARAPMSRSATEIARVSGSRSRDDGGVHSTRRTKSGVSRFSAGTFSSSDVAVIASRASSRRRAATGSLSAQARGGGGPSERGVRVGSWASGRSRTWVRTATQRPAYRSAPRP